VGEVNDSDLERLYQTSDIFALSPSYEAFGLVYLEAGSYGLPLVTWDVGAIKEVLGTNALITHSGDLASLAASLVSLVNDKNLRLDWAHKAKTLSERYSWDNTAKLFLDLYKK
jgi:glycosyltransferase involved in cell wall biosynthesis